MSATIAVVDDDPEMLELLSTVLGGAGYKVNAYSTPGRFLDGVAKTAPDLCVVDVVLPGMDGRDLIRILRSNPETKRSAMIAITASATKSGDAVRGLDGGADEYMSKPLDLELFVVRVQNLLSRTPNGAPRAEVLRWKDVELVPEEHRVTVGGKEVELTHLEFKLLASFLRQPNRVLARSWLLQTVWGSTPGIATRTVDKHVETVRKKVPSISTRIETVVGVGYLFRP